MGVSIKLKKISALYVPYFSFKSTVNFSGSETYLFPDNLETKVFFHCTQLKSVSSTFLVAIKKIKLMHFLSEEQYGAPLLNFLFGLVCRASFGWVVSISRPLCLLPLCGRVSCRIRLKSKSLNYKKFTDICALVNSLWDSSSVWCIFTGNFSQR